MPFQAEYIWIDGTEPTHKLRSKTKILADGKKPPIWGFDGSSTNQATGSSSDCVLRPVFTCPDPLRGPKDILVMCEVLNADMTPHPTNTRAALEAVAKKYASFEPMFGIVKELSLQFVLGYTPEEFARSLRLLAEGEVDAAALITGKVGLDGVKGAFEELGNPERHTKILVEPWR